MSAVLATLIFQFHKGTIKTTAIDKVHGQFVKFQFHKGTIKTQASLARMSLNQNFNSIKVRLKPRTHRRYLNPREFQFHKGTIKTLFGKRNISLYLHFNSIKVRLKPFFFVR